MSRKKTETAITNIAKTRDRVAGEVSKARAAGDSDKAAGLQRDVDHHQAAIDELRGKIKRLWS